MEDSVMPLLGTVHWMCEATSKENARASANAGASGAARSDPEGDCGRMARSIIGWWITKWRTKD